MCETPQRDARFAVIGKEEGGEMRYSKFSNADENPGMVFWQTYAIWHRKILGVLRGYNLTHTQFILMAVIRGLVDEDEEVTLEAVSTVSKVDVSIITMSVRLLERRRLVIRSAPEGKAEEGLPSDLSLTAEGERVLRRANKAVEKADANFFFMDATLQGTLICLLKKLMREPVE
ncbi:MAG: hypothetical protein LBD12_03155 [Clostridiales Family XIII bacterium]|jgi:DNA-binding MarR family transcriptional regulator|nr:hypothetical protein [Clostridiales Family XIII bacterium]